jgi:hypothetical protein
MAHKIQSFKVDEKKKQIIIYTNVESNPAEELLKSFYLNNGYMPMMGEKKKGATVEEMRKDMEGTEYLERFNAAYKEKGGFHVACKIYNEWKKANKEQ